MDPIKILLLIGAAVLFAWTAYRWRMTDSDDTEYPVRRDTCALFGMVLLGEIGDIVRSRFAEHSNASLYCSLAMLPIAVIAVYLLVRLTRAYRRSHSI